MSEDPQTSPASVPGNAPPEGYLWHPLQPPPVPFEPPAPPLPPKLIPSLGHTILFFVLLVPTFVAGFVLTFLILLLLLHPVSPGALVHQMNEVRYAIPMQAVAYGLQWGLSALIFGLLWRMTFREGIHWHAVQAQRWFLRLVLLGAATGLIITLAGNFLPMPKAPPILEDLTKSTSGAWMLMVFGITLAPLTEELAFRGFLLPGLVNVFRWLERRGLVSEATVRSIGVPIAVILTSIPFAMLHAQQVSDSWGPLLLIGMVSVVLCIVRLAANSLAASVVVHAAYNFTLFAALLAQTDGFRHLEKLNS